MMIRRTRRRGFVLLAVLWVIVGIAVLGVGLDLTGRGEVAAAGNRVALTRGEWLAEGCIARARAAITQALVGTDSVAAVWDVVDALLRRDPSFDRCGVQATPVGLTRDVNTAAAGELRRLFVVDGIPNGLADSLAAALVDWRDPDDVPLPNGAERKWYLTNGRVPPRNGPFASVEELRLVRGFHRLLAARPDIASALGVEPTPILLSRAPLAVLASLPGFTDEATARVATLRSMASTPLAISDIADALSPLARDSLLAHAPELASLTTSTVGVWVLTSHVTVGERRVPATVEVTIARAGTRVAIVRRRSWP